MKRYPSMTKRKKKTNGAHTEAGSWPHTRSTVFWERLLMKHYIPKVVVQVA